MAKQTTEERQPGYRLVNRESDLTGLIPGDRVKVQNDSRVYQVYQRMDHGKGNEGLNPKSKAFFIQIPEGYEGENDVRFELWESYVKYLQFGDGVIYFDSYHRDLALVGPGTKQHAELKTLVDMLVK